MPKFSRPDQLFLSNGIPVILQHHDGLVSASYWWVQTGSADEAPDEAGFAHFLEHMLFKDAAAKETGRASTGKMALSIESLGGDINAYTSFDQTVYHVTCAEQHWERVLDAFGVIARPQRFLKQDFEREREVILEELRKNEDSPGRQLFQSLFSTTFAKHPYGRPVIGFSKTLKAATVQKLEAFYRRNYVTDKMGLVLVGPIDSPGGERRKSILKVLEKHFGSRVLPRKEAVRKPRVVEPAIRKSANWVQKKFDVNTPSVAIAFRAPELRHPDIPALDMISHVLAMGELSRLYQNLFYKSAIATDVSGGLYVPHDPGLLYFQAEMDGIDKIRPAVKSILDEAKRIQSEGPSEEEMSRVLVNAESERLYATQTADGVAGRLGFLRFIVGDLNFDRTYLEELKSLDKERVQEVAARYLDPRRMSGVALLPKAISKSDFSLSEIAGLSNRLATRAANRLEVPAKGVTKAELLKVPGAEFFTLPSGIRVVFRENAQSHVMSIQAVVLGGVRLELIRPIEKPETDWGSSYMMSLTWTKGTETRDARAIAAVVEGHAASLDGFSGRNTVGLQMTGLARDWQELSELFTDVLVDPVFPEDEVSHSRRVAEDSVRSVEDHSSQLCSKLFLETLFENHPYGYMTMGSLESLSTINSAKLRAFHRAWVRPERLVISVVGAVKRTELDRWLENLDRKIGEALRKISSPLDIPLTVPEESLLKAPRWVEKKLGREQSHIVVGTLGTRVSAKDRYAVRLMQTLLGGQSGRLFIELREKKSLAYTVAPVSFEGIERGYIGTYIACAPQKRQEALAGIRAVMEKLASRGPSAAEMKRAQEFFLGRRAMDLQSDSAMASHYSLNAIYGIPLTEDKEIVEKVISVTPGDVQEVCRQYLVEPSMVTSVVG